MCGLGRTVPSRCLLTTALPWRPFTCTLGCPWVLDTPCVSSQPRLTLLTPSDWLLSSVLTNV